MVQIYADGALAYDSRVPEYELLELTADIGLNKGGAAYITMPPSHPAFNSFVNYKTIVEIVRDNEIIFRGRALYPSDDFLHRRTITCEGERCFLRDAVIRPYVYQGTPASAFSDIVSSYNAQVEEDKRFAVGTVTVTKSEGVALSNEEAETADAVIDKLQDLCGGYIVFTTNAQGRRSINWYASIGYANNQTIEFGENLLDFSSSDANTDLATVVVPYGAKDETTGQRITIASVNGGRDYIEDAAAVAIHGRIAQTVTWDDVSTPEVLLENARAYLASSKLVLTTLSLTAVDLSTLDKSIDSFRVGDIVRVRSAPHGVDDDYLLTERGYDFLHLDADRVTFGKSLVTLTGSTVASYRKSETNIQRTARTIREDVAATYSTRKQLDETDDALRGTIRDTDESIRIDVASTYATLEELNETDESIRSDVAATYATKGQVAEINFGTIQVAQATIQASNNLNVYRTPGVYAVPTSAIAASLVNKSPSDEAGTLRVYNALGSAVNTGAGVYLIQEYRSVDAEEPTYRRVLHTDGSGTWQFGTWN